MDVARILVRTKRILVLNEAFNVKINGDVFRLKVIEDSHGPLRVFMSLGSDLDLESSESYVCSNGWIGEKEEISNSKEKDNIDL